MTKLQLINNCLQLIGENQLLSSTGNLGTLATNVINTAIANIAGETRANVFEQVLAGNVTAADYLTSALTLPANTIQVYSVLIRISTGLASGDKLIPLEYLPLESTPNEPSYSIVGSNIFVSPTIARPFTLRVHTIAAPVLPASDNDDSGLPDVVIPVVSHAAAAILALSYLDDSNQAAVHRNIAEQLTDKLRKQYGNNRAKSFNIGGSRNASGFSYGTVSSVSGGVAYAPLDSAAVTGSWTLNGSVLINQSSLNSALSPYLTSAIAASTYATIASITDTSNVSPALINGWFNFGGSFQNIGYRRKANGTVFIRGVLANGSIPATGTVIFNLNSGFRPPSDLVFICQAGTAGTGGNGLVSARIDITSAGDVRWQGLNNSAPGTTVQYLGLNLSFETT